MIWSWITNEWRLKALAVGLSVLVLGAVAFSQNPPTTRTIRVPLHYSVQSNIVLINPPSDASVTISGLADTIARADSSNIIATADASRALPGTDRISIQVTRLISGVSVQQPGQIAVTVDTYQAVTLPVQVNARAAPGWNIDPSKTLATCNGASVATNRSPCKVVFTGPVSWETNLKAVAVLQGNAIGVQDSLNQPVTLVNATGPLDQSVRTVPGSFADVTSVDIHTEAVQGTTTASVPLLVATITQPPPPGFRVTAITISPASITVTGDPVALQRLGAITLQAANLGNSTADATFTVQVQYPNGITGSVTSVTVKYSIGRDPNVTPSA